MRVLRRLDGLAAEFHVTAGRWIVGCPDVPSGDRVMYATDVSRLARMDLRPVSVGRSLDAISLTRLRDLDGGVLASQHLQIRGELDLRA